MTKYDLKELLEYIDPSSLSYQEWCNVGMALKHEGYSADDWDSWSSADSRYKKGECFTKWNSFNEEAGAIVTGGTVFEYAKRGGWHPPVKEKYKDGAIDWDDEIGSIIDTDSVDSIELQEPSDNDWHPSNELIRYLSTLFETDDYVGFVMQSMENDKGKYIPGNRGIYRMTAGELIEKLHKCNDDIGEVLGDYNQEAGAWIRFNPLNGEGVRNADITSFKYALVESDSIDIGKQLSIIHQIELPVAAVVYSGSKSIHAIVKIEANDSKEYKERVAYLYKICDKNGLEVDGQNKNPSRLSRMPGVIRGEHKQFIIETNTGKESYDEWVEWIESIDDDLPDEECLADSLKNIPDYAEELIPGILRQGHKMLLVGPSKSGKSFALIELCIAITEGTEWIGRKCKQGNVLYVNFELDRPSCLHRFEDVYNSLGIPEGKRHSKNLYTWNLRGKTLTLDKLVPKLIRRAKKRNYRAVVIDPIYKVITGDENSASEMANFCNQFDKIAEATGASVIYAHHHSKGAQGSKKSMDRASGSGVFARDPVTGERIKVPADETYKEWYQRMVEKHGADAINTAEKLVENRSSDRKQQIKYLDLLGKQNIPLSLSEFQNLKYNDKENWLLLQKYKRSRSSGKLSAFSTFEDYKKYRKIIQDEIVGRTTKDGVVIKSQSDHFIERVLGTTEKEGPQKNKKREGVEIEDVISALTDPEKITEKENGKRISRKYIGENVEVTLNPDTGNLIQTNPKKRE